MRFYCLLFLSFTWFHTLSQQSTTQNLLSENLRLLSVTNYSAQALSSLSAQLSLPNDFQLNKIHVVKNRLLLTEKGTGRILMIDSTGIISRIDATKYGGDRFGAFEFVFNDTLYSIGGYGFWRVTGAVRRFDWDTKDWTAVLSNKHIPAALGINAYFHFIPEQGRVFVLFSNYPDEYLLQSSVKSKGVSIAIFDIASKKWNELTYAISSDIINEISDIRAIANTDYSLIIHTRLNTHTIELDFTQNQYYHLADDFLNKLYSITGQKNAWVTKSKGTSILIGNLSDTQFQQIDTKAYRSEKIASFYKTDTSNNKPEQNKLINIFSIALNALLLLIGTILLFNHYRKKTKTSNTIDQTQTNQHKQFTDLLDEVEIVVVEKIWLNSKSGENTSIDEINKLLGIDKRPYKIQNNLRADALKLINKKFNDFTNTRDELIARKRSDFDKRFFTYHINERYINKIIIRKNDA